MAHLPEADEQEAEAVDLGSDDPEANDFATLEEKYRDQMRQIFPQKIELPISTLPEMIKAQINLSPEFQRRDIWDEKKRSRFIESIIMNVPIPPVFLGEDEYGKYVVLDGRQRLTAVNEFMANSYKLCGLKVWREFNDQSFNEMVKQGYDKAITRRFIPAVLILKESSPEVKYDVFDRLNTGGVVATPMEIRNAVYRGKFNENLKAMSNQFAFRRLWDIPVKDVERERTSNLYRRMEDLELVLRFFALRDVSKYEKFRGTFKDYLNNVMNARNAEYAADVALAVVDATLFERVTSRALKAFGTDAFRKPQKNGKKGVKSAPLADAILQALADVTVSDAQCALLPQAFEKLMAEDPEFRKATGTGTNGRGATRYRIAAAKKVVASLFGDTATSSS